MNENLFYRLVAAVEQSANTILSTDLDGKITYVNEAFVRTSGYRKEEALGQNPRFLKSGHQAPEIYTELWDAITQGNPWEGDFKNIRKDGTFYWEHALITPILNNKNEIIEYVAIKEDITKQKEIQESILKAKKDLEKKNKELEKLDQLKSDFVSIVSHELRTPLAISTEGINLVVDGIVGSISEQQKELLITSRDNLKRLNLIINDLLDMQKIESGKISLNKGLVDFKALVKSLADDYKKVLSTKKQIINVSMPKSDILLYIDPNKIIQVITNLLNNANKFTPEGGRIDITLAMKKKEVLCSVKDSGVGISQENMKKLFRKFQQFARTDGPGLKGTELGLSIAKSLVEIHEGKIWAESQPTEGTTFNFTLPNYKNIKRNFDMKMDNIIQNTIFKKRQTCFIALHLSNYDELRKKFDETVMTEAMNNTLSSLTDIITRPTDIFILYDNHTIYIVLPYTKAEGGHRIVFYVKKAIKECKLKIKNESVLEWKFGLSICPNDGDTRDKLVAQAFHKIKKTKTVLVVDDHPQIIRILEKRLSHLNINVKSACDGVDALTKIKKNIPDLIILDIMLPKMNGYELMGRLKENAQTVSIPIIILTAKQVSTVLSEYKGVGSIPVINKTGGFSYVVELIQEILN